MRCIGCHLLSPNRRKSDITNVISHWLGLEISIQYFRVVASLKNRKVMCLTYKWVTTSESWRLFQHFLQESLLSALDPTLSSIHYILLQGPEWIHAASQASQASAGFLKNSTLKNLLSVTRVQVTVLPMSFYMAWRRHLISSWASVLFTMCEAWARKFLHSFAKEHPMRSFLA